MAQPCTNSNAALYQPLQNPRSIRLLILLPGKFGDTIQCCLFPFELSKAIPYEALSYCWGVSKPSVSIVCNGQPFEVRPNLGAALQRLRYSNIGASPRIWLARALWIDAVCINQVDLGERSQQVSFMADIYRQARKTLIWLGEDDSCATSAFSIIHKVAPVALAALLGRMAPVRKESAASVTEALSTTTSTGQDSEPVDHDVKPTRLQRLMSGEEVYYHDFLPSRDHSDWLALLELLKNSYFTRVWIIQEIFLASEAIILIGRCSLSWGMFGRSIVWLRNNGYFAIFRTLSLAREVSKLYNRGVPGLSLGLHVLLTVHGACEATDPRDKIYALLGLMSEKERNVPELQPDYEKPVVDIYISVARYLLVTKSDSIVKSRQGTVDVLVSRQFPVLNDRKLEYLTSEEIEAESCRNGFPSWVPLWNRRKQSVHCFYECPAAASWKTGGRVPVDILHASDSRHLIVRGIRCQTITSVLYGGDTQKPFERLHLIERLAAENNMDKEWTSGLFYSSNLWRFKNIWSELSTPLNNQCVDRYGGLGFLWKAFISCVGMGYIYDPLWKSKMEKLQKVPLPEDGDLDGVGHVNDERFWSNIVEGYCDPDRKFFVTREGYIGMADWAIQEGDEVCLLYSGHALYVVRKEGDHFLFLGDCYVPGLMDGEILSMRESGKVKDEWIELW